MGRRYGTKAFNPNGGELVKLSSILALSCALAVAGCSDDPTSPNTGVSGSLSFSYTGAGATSATTYSASGTAPSNIETNNGNTSWAVGGVSTADNQVVVVASVPKTSTTWDQIVIGIDRSTTGTSTISSSCSDEDSCTGVFVTFGSNQSGTAFANFCTLTSGTITITALSSTNVTGTFSGTGTCISSFGATPTNFTVTNGVFNVGVTTQL
jgi:hypothetical protein